jgi:hypothetical protein
MKAELEFHYQPVDYFEEPLALTLRHGKLSAANGKAEYELAALLDPVPEAFRREAMEEVSGVFKIRQLLLNRPFKLFPPSVVHHDEDGTEIRSIQVSGVASVGFVASLDIMKLDNKGNVTEDSRAERLKQHGLFMASLLSKAANPTLRALLDSYGKAVDDPANALVHLYEIREAISRHFGDETAARKAFGISNSKWKAFGWSELGRLANDAPLRQGRHRGKHGTLRDATPAELAEARSIARRLIEAFVAAI